MCYDLANYIFETEKYPCTVSLNDVVDAEKRPVSLSLSNVFSVVLPFHSILSSSFLFSFSTLKIYALCVYKSFFSLKLDNHVVCPNEKYFAQEDGSPLTSMHGTHTQQHTGERKKTLTNTFLSMLQEQIAKRKKTSLQIWCVYVYELLRLNTQKTSKNQEHNDDDKTHNDGKNDFPGYFFLPFTSSCTKLYAKYIYIYLMEGESENKTTNIQTALN